MLAPAQTRSHDDPCWPATFGRVSTSTIDTTFNITVGVTDDGNEDTNMKKPN
jgi:hypothetical protein